MLSSNQYPEYIMRMLREHEGLEPDNHNHDAVFQHMAPSDVFSKVLEQEGFVNHDWTIKKWIRDIYKVNLDHAGE